MTSHGAAGGVSTIPGGCATDCATDCGVTVADGGEGGVNVEGPPTARLHLPPVVHSKSRWKLGHQDRATPAGTPPDMSYLNTGGGSLNEGELFK